MSNITSCDSGSFSTENTRGELGQFHSPNSHTSTTTNNSNGSNTDSQPAPPPLKKKRNLPGNPDPSAEVISLSPTTLTAKNRFICEICHKGFQRDQNLQLHRRGHNLPWKLKQRTGTEVRKRVYVCPEPSCVHHNPARALGDLTGIKKHFSRKHGEKKWKCDKCSKKYAVQSDLKAHFKICGTREYKCDCGTIFSRRDSFITHRAFCDALAEENHKANEEQLSRMGSNLLPGQPISNLRVSSLPNNTNGNPQIGSFNFNHYPDDQIQKHPLSLAHELNPAAKPINNMASSSLQLTSSNSLNMFEENNGFHLGAVSPHMSATALLQKAAQMGATVTMSNTDNSSEKTTFVTTSSMAPPSFVTALQQPPSNDQNFFLNHQYINMQQHNGQHEISSQYNAFNGMVGMNGVEMFNVILDQSKALSKIIEQNSSRSSTSNVSVLQSGGATNGGSSSSSNINIGGNNKGSEDVMTLDLLGIGGGGGGAHGNNFYGIGGAQQVEAAATDHGVWRNWSTKINSGFESFSAI